VIWRTARIWAWFDGILTEENMNRCVYNNYCFEGFWRAWHRSFNIWLIRYIYIPLGGAKTKIFNLWIIFSFVALWHDLKINLLIWGWFICFFLVPEILVKNYFNKDNMKFIHNKFWFRVVKYIFCSFYIMLMIVANLIGFGMGSEGVNFIIKKILKMTSPIYFIKILIFLIPSTVTMFYVRELEYVYFGKKLNY
jgi:D-alanyl-lipoteichoic acid acyltransferase DltB (MBOAT superfamily)